MSEKKKLNLFEKIQLVSNEVRNIEKDMTVGKGNYAYKAVSDAAVTLAVKDAETKHRIVSVPMTLKRIGSEVLKTVSDSNKESVKFIDDVELTTRIIDLDDPEKYIDIVTLGKGVDTADKGFGKASTYARKYALLNVYKIATGEDPDKDKSPETSVKKTVSEKMKAIEGFLAMNHNIRTEVLTHFNIQEISDLTEKEVGVVYESFKKKGRI